MAEINIENVLQNLTQKEKIDLLSGADFWNTKSIPKHGIPSLRLSDGPSGVRGQSFFAGSRGAVFPCGTALGATWDQELLYRAGRLMGSEAIAKGVHVHLAPTVNIQRGPLGGRGFESLSEDPVLSGIAAAALINGVQSHGVVACIKHFVCNDQEHERNRVDVLITQRALREIYLMPFMIALKKSNPKSLMSSYNKVNGVHVSESKELLHDILREEWGWDGAIVSDWFGTYSTSRAIHAGLDLEMPGPGRFRAVNLGHAVTTGKVQTHTLNDRARAMLKLVNHCAESKVAENAPELEIDSPETSALLREVSSSSIVLLKNEKDVLPLSKSKSTLVIGPNARVATICGGGSASLPAYREVTPYDGIRSKLDSSVELPFTIGAYSHKELPLLGLQVKTAAGEDGMSFSVYNEHPDVKDRKRVDYKALTKTDAMLMDYKVPGNSTGLWYADIEGLFTPEIDGEYELGLCVYGSGKLFVNGKLVIDNTTDQKQGTVFFGCGTVEEKGTVSVKKGTQYHIKVEFASAPTNKLGGGGVVRFGGGGFRVGGAFVIDAEKEIESAVSMAGGVEQVVICAGLNADWESEGGDRQSLGLPGHLDTLIKKVARANKQTTVVLQGGTPVSMPWIDDVSAVLYAWYGGNETGNAIADVLFGDINPSGKLPLSFPKQIEDNPSFLSFRSERGRVLYGEDVFVGYRYYEALKKEVLFPFGHGLSYTTFAFSNLSVIESSNNIKVSVSVKNTGSIAGAEVVQVYVSQRKPSIRRANKELRGYTKVFLQPGETKECLVEVETKYATSFWDEERKAWITERDTYDVIVGNTSSPSAALLSKSFELKNTIWWKGL